MPTPTSNNGRLEPDDHDRLIRLDQNFDNLVQQLEKDEKRHLETYTRLVKRLDAQEEKHRTTAAVLDGIMQRLAGGLQDEEVAWVRQQKRDAEEAAEHDKQVTRGLEIGKPMIYATLLAAFVTVMGMVAIPAILRALGVSV